LDLIGPHLWARWAQIAALAAGLFTLALSAQAARAATDDRQERGPVAATEDGFVPVTLSEESSVDGKVMMILAYGIILGGLLAYAFSLLKREQAVNKEIAELTRRLKDRLSRRE